MIFLYLIVENRSIKRGQVQGCPANGTFGLNDSPCTFELDTLFNLGSILARLNIEQII